MEAAQQLTFMALFQRADPALKCHAGMAHRHRGPVLIDNRHVVGRCVVECEVFIEAERFAGLGECSLCVYCFDGRVTLRHGVLHDWSWLKFCITVFSILAGPLVDRLEVLAASRGLRLAWTWLDLQALVVAVLVGAQLGRTPVGSVCCDGIYLWRSCCFMPLMSVSTRITFLRCRN